MKTAGVVGKMRAVSDCWQGFDVAVGRWRLGELVPERLPDAAVQALVAGCDTTSLVRLAGMDGAGWSEVEPVLGQVFEDRGRPLPSVEEAVKWVADSVLRELVAGDVEPRSATEQLRILAWKAVDSAPWEDLLVFVGLSDDWVLPRPGT